MNPSNHRAWIFTLNKPSSYDCEHLVDLQMQGEFAYIGFGLENAPTTGTEHLQGFFYTKKKMSLRDLKGMMPRAHLERMKGTFQENLAYCSKDNHFVSFGDIPAQGARTDINEFVKIVKESPSMDSVIRADPIGYLKFGHKAERVFLAFHKPTEGYRTPRVEIIWGPTGSNKSRRVREWCQKKRVDLFVKNSTMGHWWDGYDQEKAVLFDDFRASHFPLSDLLQILDGYGLQVQQKGTKCILTC